LALGGVFALVGLTTPLSLEAAQGVRFVAPATHVSNSVVLTAAVEPIAPAQAPQATRLSAPVGQPRRSSGPIEFISPASRSVCPPFSLINPVETPPLPAAPAAAETPTPLAGPTTIPTVAVESPLTTQIPNIPAFNFDDLLAAVSPTSVMQPAEEVAPPAVSEPSPLGADSPMDPLMFNTREFRPITQVTANTALPPGLAPGQPGSETKGPVSPRFPEISDARFFGGWPQSDYQWFATAFCHRPLYFEEVNVERYGYTISPVVQPVISGAHFFGTIAILPYKMTRHCPCECIYTLGHYRPGDCAPRRWHHELWDTKAAAVQGGVVTGLIFLIP